MTVSECPGSLGSTSSSISDDGGRLIKRHLSVAGLAAVSGLLSPPFQVHFFAQDLPLRNQFNSLVCFRGFISKSRPPENDTSPSSTLRDPGHITEASSQIQRRSNSDHQEKSPFSPGVLNGDAFDAFFSCPKIFQQPDSARAIATPQKNKETEIEVIKNANPVDVAKKSTPPSPSDLGGPNDCTVTDWGIQMISRALHEQIFKLPSKDENQQIEDEVLEKIADHLKAHDLWGRPHDILPEVNFKLPPLIGSDLSEHFRLMAEKQSQGYKNKLYSLIEHQVPDIPKFWIFAPGWTRYDENGETTQVDFPDEEAIVFDVEVCVKEGHAPTLATALSNHYWYSWCSNQLFEQQARKSLLKGLDPHYSLADLIPLETGVGQDCLPIKDQKERVVVGHNVSYDRARVKEQYFYKGTQLRFVDTMSMHIAVSGITSYQRAVLQASKSGTPLPDAKNGNSGKGRRKVEEVLEWQNVSSLNGLNDVHKLYCGGLALDKEKRNVFVTGSLADIKSEFQELVTYCAKDTMATYRVLSALTPEFFSRFPHPVTFAGMLEMSTSFLPINGNWARFISNAEDTYAELESEMTRSLKREADAACHLMGKKAYAQDPWLWDLDWSVQSLKIKKTVKKSLKSKGKSATEPPPSKEEDVEDPDQDPLYDKKLEEKFRPLMKTRDLLFKRNPLLPGYPAWYRALCDKDEYGGLLGPTDITTSVQVVPKLLKLTWDGYPLYHSRELGWGYLVPGRPLEYSSSDPGQSSGKPPFPLQKCLQMFPPPPHSKASHPPTQSVISVEEAMDKLQRMTSETADPAGLSMMWQAVRSNRGDVKGPSTKKAKKRVQTLDQPAWHEGIGPYDVGVPGCWFFRLPHKSGVDNNVGNPLAKDYLNKMEDGTLRATSSSIAQHVLKLNRMVIYWRNARDRILSQMVVRLQGSQMPHYTTRSESSDSPHYYGAIVPQVVTSGTLTRRAVEPTWMTASNAYTVQ
nr:EOG090X00SQ [Sida crystallina]